MRLLVSNLLYVVPDGSEGELRAVPAPLWVIVLAGDGAGCSVRAAQCIEADNEETRSVESPTGTTQKRPPPVGYVCAASQGMADDHAVVAVGRQLAPRGVGDGHIMESDTRFEGEGRDNGYLLVGDKSRERILRLRASSFLEVFSHCSFFWVAGAQGVFVEGVET